MAKRPLLFLAITLVMSLGWASSADACTLYSRKAFFASTGHGEFAHIAEAGEPSMVRTRYRRWCAVRDGDVVKATGPVLYFGVNDRSTDPGEPAFFIMRVFRYSADTRRNPLVSYRTSGPWGNSSCGIRTTSKRFLYVERGHQEVEELVRLLKNPFPARATACHPFQQWLGSAFGRPYLSLYGELPFLRAIPQAVTQRGVRNWSINLLASAYVTRPRGTLGTDFPMFEVTVDRAEELIVQLLSNNQMTTFSITS